MLATTIQNGVVESASIRYDRGVFLCVWLRIKHDDGCQGFGGWVLGKKGDKEPSVLLDITIRKILEITGSSSWSGVVGKPIRVDGNHAKIIGIGNFLKNEWFYPDEEYAKYVQKKQS